MLQPCLHFIQLSVSSHLACCRRGSSLSGKLGNQSINQSINTSMDRRFFVLGGNCDPTDNKFGSVNSYNQNLLPTCKAFSPARTLCVPHALGLHAFVESLLHRFIHLFVFAPIRSFVPACLHSKLVRIQGHSRQPCMGAFIRSCRRAGCAGCAVFNTMPWPGTCQQQATVRLCVLSSSVMPESARILV